MLVGQHPFAGHGAALTASILRDVPPAADDVRKDVPPGFSIAIATAMAKDMAERFPNAETMRAAIAPFCDTVVEVAKGGAIPANPTFDSTLAKPPGARRRRAPIWLLVTLAVTMVLVGVGLGLILIAAGNG
jgi:hypothetical protein